MKRLPPIEVPGLRGRVLAFAVPVALLGLLALGHAGLERSRAAVEQNEERARRLLALLGEAAAASGLDEPQPLQQMVRRLRGDGHPLQTAWMITEKQVGSFVFQKARTYVVHSDQALEGQKLDKEQARDKLAYDVSKDVELRFEKHARDRPDLTLVVVTSPDRRSVAAAGPVAKDGKLLGTVGLTLAAERPALPLPWEMVLLVCLSAVALATLLFRLLPAPRIAGPVALAVLAATGWLLFAGAARLPAAAGAYASARSAADLAAVLQAAPPTVQQERLVDALAAVPGPGEPAARGRAALAADLAWTTLGAGLLFLLGFLGWLQHFGRMLRTHAYAYGYAAPAMIGMALFVFFPFASGFLFSFFEYVTGDDLAGTVAMFGMNFRFLGLNNFFDILGSREYSLTDARNFYFTLAGTILWTASNVVLHLVIGLSLALVLKNQWVKLKGLYRVLLIVPWAVPNYITALVWRGMFDVEYGTVNYLFAALGIGKVAWWSHFWTAFAANLTTNVWLGFPFMMVISLGALQSIPADLYEAAEVDGASRWQQFRQITLPLLKPALFPAVILGTIWTFNMFNVIYLVSGGAPDSKTDILIVQAYRFAFEGARRYGYAAAYAVIIFLILLIYGTLTNRVTKASEGAFD